MIHQLIAFLYEPQTKLPSDPQFYREALSDITKYDMASQLYFLLNRQNGWEQVPLFFQQELKRKHQAALYQNVFIKKQMEHIFQLMETNGIDTIPLKGVCFGEEYFGHTGARPTTDIDLLVRKKDVQQAVQLVKQLGFTVEEEPIPSHFHISFSKVIPGSSYPLTVEIHWDILKETTAALSIDEFWNEKRPLPPYRHVHVLSHYHTFYMICLHGWRHNMDSPKYFVDIIQVLFTAGKQVDLERLYRDSSRHQTAKRIKRTLSIVNGQYPDLKRLFPAGENSMKKIEKPKTKLDAYREFISYQFFSYDSVRHSLVELKLWLLPSRSDLLHQLEKRGRTNAFYVFLLLSVYAKRSLHAWQALVKPKVN